MATSAIGSRNLETSSAARPAVEAQRAAPIDIDRTLANTLIELDGRGRLWVPGEASMMERIGAAAAYTRLSRGEAVHIMRLATTSQRSSHSTGEGQSRSISFGSNTSASGSSVSSSRSVEATYSFDCVQHLELLKLVDRNGRGITGAPMVPRQGGRIQVSHEFESTWVRENSHAGMLRASVGMNSGASSGKDAIV